MSNTEIIKSVFLDKEFKGGDFYELSMKITQSVDNNVVKIYTDYIWNLDNVYGPYDSDFNLIQTDVTIFQHNGVLRLDDYYIPFMTFCINDSESNEKGNTVFDICIDTTAVVRIFGSEYELWMGSDVPKQLSDFFYSIAKQLYKCYPFQLGILGWEVSSGRYNLDYLTSNRLSTVVIDNVSFFVGKEAYNALLDFNKQYITIVDDSSGELR